MSLQGPSPDPPFRQYGVIKLLLDNIEEVLASLLLIVIGVVIALQVFMRGIFSAPLSWPEELSQFLFVWASVLGAVGAAKRLGLVRFETVVERLPVSIRGTLDYVVLAVVVLLLAVLGWQGLQMANRTTYAATSLPITWWWMHIASAAFALLMITRLVQLQIFKYRFVFIEAVVANSANVASRSDSAP